MNKILISLIGAVWLLIALPSQAVTLSLIPNPATVNVGETVEVDLDIGDLNVPDQLLGAFDVTIQFDPAVLSFVAAEFGLKLGNPDISEALILSDTLINIDAVEVSEVSLLEGYASSCLSCFPPYLEGLQTTTPFTLATLTFTTLAIGTSGLTITTYTLSDAFGDLLTVNPPNTSSVAVVQLPGGGGGGGGGGGQVLPLPSSLWLMLPGLLALGSRLRNSRFI